MHCKLIKRSKWVPTEDEEIVTSCVCVLVSGDPETIDQWIDLVQEKNNLLSEESDLMVA